MIYSLKDMSDDGSMQAMDQVAIEVSMHQGESDAMEGNMIR
jgi:hypothetical protein